MYKAHFFSECFSRLKTISSELYQSACVGEYRVMHTNLSDQVDESRLLGKGKYASHASMTDYMIDYFRYRTFELAAKEIKERNVPGALAELGVFQGAFASLINETFPERTFYLFDTFESFDLNEFKAEQAKGRCGDGDVFWGEHAKTSEKIMLSNIPMPESCVVCKGLFPATVPSAAEKERFAFVSLDVDLEESTYQGLSFFILDCRKMAIFFCTIIQHIGCKVSEWLLKDMKETTILY